MTKGLDELIERLVAETAYCGETGLSVDDFVNLVSRLNGQSQKTEPDAEAQRADVATNALVDMPLARKAWEWLTICPEILVGRDGSRRKLSLDDAFALPEPQAVVVGDENGGQTVKHSASALDTGTEGTVDTGKGVPKSLAKKGKKQAAFPPVLNKQEKQLSRRGDRTDANNAAAAGSAQGTNLEIRPRLYVTERTLWYTLTGHDVDYKKVPLLEWKCLQGIASVRRKGILQADLRILVDQDKRSVPKRTDFLAAKGYIVKRTTIARGYRTSMMWLTEFAPIELPDGDESTKKAAKANLSKRNASEVADSSLLSPTDLASSGIDFSPEFLKKNLEPVPWRDRWLGDAIEFASFGQTVLAIVKAWGVMRVVDLKIKMGILSKRWQMRTLARVCREFSASGVLRFVAAMHPDERKMFKDCIKFERDPTPNEWTVYLAAGRRRTPLTDMRAKLKKEQDQQRSRNMSLGTGTVDGDDSSLLDPMDLAALEEEEEYEFGEGGIGGAFGSGGLAGAKAAGAAHTPAWASDIPLVNLIYDTIDRCGIDGITSPEICRATMGTAFSRYIFTLVTAMARPGTQPAHLQKFQLHCESTRVGKNHAYLFRTLENAKLAERLGNGESLDEIEQQTVSASITKHADAARFWDLNQRGVLQDLPPDELRRLYGFESSPEEPTAEEVEQQRVARRAVVDYPRSNGPGRPKKNWAPDAIDHRSKSVEDALPVLDDEVDVSMQENEADANMQGSEADASLLEAPDSADAMALDPSPPRRKRGRPRKSRSIVEDVEEDLEEKGALATELDVAPSTNKVAGQIPAPLPLVRFGEPGSLHPNPKSIGRLSRSAVLIIRHDQLRDPNFLSSQAGYRDGPPRLEPDDEQGKEDEAVLEQTGDNTSDAEMQAEADSSANGPSAAALQPVAVHYNGCFGQLTYDLTNVALLFTDVSTRRGRSAAKPKVPITIPVDDLVSDPLIRKASGGDGQALFLEMRESKTDGPLKDSELIDGDDSEREVSQIADGTIRSVVFVLDKSPEDNESHAVALCESLVASRSQPAGDEQDDDGDKPQPLRRRGRRPGKKKKKIGQTSTKKADVGSEQYVCETCSGVWKNIHGLQYHQTKSKAACNPDYVDKRKTQCDGVEQPVQGGETNAEPPSSLAQTRGRRELRPRKPPIVPVRDSSSASVASSRSNSPALSVSEVESYTSPESPPRRNNYQRLEVHSSRRTPAYQLAVFEDSDSDNDKNGPRGIAGAMRAALISRKGPSPTSLQSLPLTGDPLDCGNSSSPELEAIPATKRYEVTGAIKENREGGSVSATLRQGNHASANGHNSYSRPPSSAPAAAVRTETHPSSRRVSLARNLDVDQSTASTAIFVDSVPTTSPGRGAAGFWMPPLPKNTINKLSPFAVRSLIVMEITKYLVDYFGGVFPSDRSLWYAAFRIYMRSYPGEDPPTLTATKAAIKKLEIGKEVEEHTFGFRDPRGQFIYCRLLVRPGIDVFQSETAAEFKRQVQAAYPQPYVPDEFVPSDKDMAVLRILDKDIDKSSTRGARGRRPLAPQIEVLHAPFYEQQPVVRPVPKTVVLLDNDEDGSNDFEKSEVAEQAQQGEQRRPSNLKRKVATSGAKGQGAPKRRRTRFADAIASHELNEDNEDNDSASADVGAAGNDHADLSVASDNEADIDPALRTVKTTESAPRTSNTPITPTTPATSRTTKMPKARKPAATGNPGLESLPASFFAPSTAHSSQSRSKRPIQLRDEADDGFATFVHFLPPNKHLEDGQEALQQQPTDFNGAGQELARTAAERATPRQIKFVTKTHQLHDMGEKSARAWPVITETTFERQSDASFTMDGFMPTRKALLRENLPRTPLECAAMLRGNQKISIVDDTPESRVLCDLDYCRSWELSQMGTDILSQPSVAPHYVFLNVSFPGEHYTAEMGEAEAAVQPVAKTEAISPMCWLAKNQFTVETIPYGALDADEPGSAVDSLIASSAPVQRRSVMSSGASGAGTGTTGDLVAIREKQMQQAKYLAHSRREMTAYPQTPVDFLRLETEAHSGTNQVDWSSNETLLATFIVIKTLLGGLNQTIDWGLLMRLFPNKQVSALRLFWTNTRRERQPHIDELTERFQQAFLAAYDKRELPPLDFDNVLAYDWPWLISWALPHLTLRQEGAIIKLPATREALWGENSDNVLAEMPLVRTAAWREEFFQVSRSVWNRLRDSASEAAALALDQPLPITPAEIVAVGGGGSLDQLRNIVARSWIRALCGTPYQRYPPSQIKQKLLTLGSIGSMERSGGNGSVAVLGNTLGETDTNSLLQTVISNLTNDRILRRAKSMMSLGGRMYMLTEVYESSMEKMASEAKFLRAYKFKEMLDEVFGGGLVDSYEISVESNDDGMVMALLNMQAHGRIMLEAVDAPHIPFGFEPGNYESRKFPKQYQRFRLRIKPTAMYMYNEHEYLKQTFDRIGRAWHNDEPSEVAGLGDAEMGDAPPKQGRHQEMPIWRDFFGVLDRGWFARLTGAVVFSLATRGASPVKQTTAHLRPIVEPFEVQMITDWATRLGFLAGGQGCDQDLNQFPPGSRMVTEWWWLLLGHMYLSVKGEVVQEVASTNT
ncbi:hypothetical protein SEPCBS57363_005096 [Sporothrix epigloea]|uniref:TFIIIC transcription initiation factor complex subunits Tfc3 n=1 Tax=Sporothrix epigloea TaxID=1892477 RepID=A0ABP0DYJ1_9PEZI